ncbi:hypothetical protein CRV00_10725 [Malaciobacter molluscorum]|uniref:hypothetical protein n=1 Tax=Malaciobacter molluscorum TaxID=1032072 RepID=UPI00100BD497|nr:hypothetical protein [Malaciobacter molluscorum]RXJ93550.1 hypothetical protein CRV00_10725 [Malaciobacter molluscorum]
MKIESNHNNSKNLLTIENNREVNKSFKNTLFDEYENIDSDFSYEKIVNTDLSDISSIYKNSEDIKRAKSLKIATMFSDNEILSKALYEKVFEKSLSNQHEYLFNIIQDKIVFLSSDSTTIEDLLQKSVKQRIKLDNTSKDLEQISPKYMNTILTYMNSISFINSMSNSYKSLSSIYDKDDKYSILYNNHYLEYQFLIARFKEYDKQIEKLRQL